MSLIVGGNSIWTETLTFVFASGETTEKTDTITIEGTWEHMIVVCSSASGATVTATVTVEDGNSISIGPVSTLLAEGTTTKYAVSQLLSGTTTVGVTPSIDPQSAYTVTVYLKGQI